MTPDPSGPPPPGTPVPQIGAGGEGTSRIVGRLVLRAPTPGSGLGEPGVADAAQPAATAPDGSAATGRAPRPARPVDDDGDDAAGPGAPPLAVSPARVEEIGLDRPWVANVVTILLGVVGLLLLLAVIRLL